MSRREGFSSLGLYLSAIAVLFASVYAVASLPKEDWDGYFWTNLAGIGICLLSVLFMSTCISNARRLDKVRKSSFFPSIILVPTFLSAACLLKYWTEIRIVTPNSGLLLVNIAICVWTLTSLFQVFTLIDRRSREPHIVYPVFILWLWKAISKVPLLFYFLLPQTFTLVLVIAAFSIAMRNRESAWSEFLIGISAALWFGVLHLVFFRGIRLSNQA